MAARERSTSIFSKMVGIFILITIVIGAGLVASLLVFSARDRRAQAAGLAADDIETAMLNARRNEKDFQLRDLSQEQFHKTGQTDNLKKHGESLAAMDQSISRLEKLHVLSRSGAISELRDADAAYDASFDALVAAYRVLGFQDFGLEGELRAAAHDLEGRVAALKNPALEVDLLTIRRNEKDYLLRGDEGYVKEATAAVSQMRADAQKLGGANAAGLTDGLDRYESALGRYVQKVKEIGVTEADGLQGAMRSAIHKVEPIIPLIIADADAAGQAANRALVTITLVVLGVGIAAGILAFALFARSLTRPIRGVAGLVARVATGDLTAEVEEKHRRRRDEVGILARSVAEMSARMREMVLTIQSSAEQVAASSEQISSSARSLAEGAQAQASTLEETSASMEELNASVEQVSSHAQSQAAAVHQGSASMAQVQKAAEQISVSLGEIAGLSSTTSDNARRGEEAVQTVVQGITRIAEGSQKIGGIVALISDIADQTNLLALNASIEAARAGEHGRGFAVVADEVSKLADRSAASAKEIETLITASLKDVAEGVQVATGSQAAIEQIRSASRKVSDMISELSASMEQQVAAVKELTSVLAGISEMSQGISAATEEQSVNAKQVARAIESVNEVTQSTASATEETSSSTEQLSGQAQELQQLTAQFKVSAAAAPDAQRLSA